jgi:ribosomal-protein-alanine N-acetyltransferase
MKTKVAIYLPDKYGRVLLGRRITHEKGMDNEWWDIIGGDIKDGETVEKATIRDVKEDTDIDVRHVAPLFEEMEETKSGSWKAQVVMADKYEGEPRIVIKEKFCEFRWFAFDRLPEHLYPVTRKVLTRLGQMLAEKYSAQRAQAEKDAIEREKALAKEKSSREKQFDGPIDCYRVVLRRWVKKDAQDFTEYVERILTTHSEHCVHKSSKGAPPKLDDYIADKTKWAVELKDSGKVIGGFSLEQRNATEADMFHTMDEKHTGGGFTTEATRGLVNFGFEIIGLSTIHTALCETNLGGVKVANASGFKFDGISTHKQSCRFDKKLHATKNFSVTADEWKNFKTEHKIK